MGVYVVTGATSGIGKAIAEKLRASGEAVYAFGRNDADLCDVEAIKKLCDKISENKIDGLVNAAGVAYYGTHETITPEQIAEMVDVNVKAPMILTKLLLPKIRNAGGKIVNISSITAKKHDNTHGASYGATKAALTSFGDSLFEEVRKTGVGVVNVHPDITDTALYRHADFGVTGDPAETLFADDVADAVLFALNAREGTCVRDVTVTPQKFRIEKRKNVL